LKAPRFYFVTNDLPLAALEFHCHPGNLPRWLAVVDNLDDWMKIPSGAKCMGLWYGSVADLEGWRNVWSTRKDRGDLVGIAPQELDKIHAWAETARKAPNLKLLYGIGSAPDGIELAGAQETSDDVPDASSITAEEHAAPPAVILDQQQNFVKRGQKWT
jgi:hypothetical protein